jgi:RluA family pseudouridine synthase
MIPVIDQGNGWVCVEKPAGISVHNDPGKDLVSMLAGQPEFKGLDLLQPVHRLDRETSGLLVLATDKQSLTRLSQGFASGQMKKHYQALVHGNFPENQPTGEWTWSLTKQAGGRKNPAGRGKKQGARTRYAVLAESPHYTLLDIELFTGKKHQIRRHAKLAGHPVVGDSRYGSPRAIAFLAEHRGFSRMALHACCLAFKDLATQILIKSPELPGEIQTLLEKDR